MRKLAAPFLTVLVISIFYASSLARDITWANHSADGGDLITAAATGGVAHPSGYPTYLVFAKLFQFLPFGTLAFRTNLLSAVSALCASIVLVVLVQREVVAKAAVGRVAGFLSGVGFGLSPLLWSQAVVAEVYTLNALFVVLILWSSVMGSRLEYPWGRILTGLGSWLFGFAVGNHVTVVLLLPVWLLFILSDLKPLHQEAGWLNRLKWGSLLMQVFWFILGTSIYLSLPLRALSGSPLNWGDPVSWEGIWWLVSGRLYQSMVFNLSLSAVWFRLGQWFSLLRSQYTLVGLLLGLAGLFFGRFQTKYLRGATVYIFLVYSIFAVGYNSEDWFVLLIPSFLVIGFWFGIGVVLLLKKIAPDHWLGLGSALLLWLLLGNAGLNYSQVDASQDKGAVDFGENVLADLPADALVIVRETRDTFTLWYYHFALGRRPDIAVLNSGLLAYDWYRDRMGEIYPGIRLSDPENCHQCMLDDLTSANDRPICQTFLNEPKQLTCSP